MVLKKGIEPSTSVWKTDILPLNYFSKKHKKRKLEARVGIQPTKIRVATGPLQQSGIAL